MDLIKKMPKVDLHYHLDGGMRPQSIIDIAREENIDLPTYDLNEIEPYLSVTDDCPSLVEYLKKFDLPLKCLQLKNSQQRAAIEAVEDASAENVKYIEIRFAPNLMTEGGQSVFEVTENVLEGIRQGSEKTGVIARAILICMRHQDKDKNLEVIEAAREYMKYGVCAVDLAGDEKNYPPQLHREVFVRAAHYGIPVTIHAGEADGPQNIATAVNELGAVRIGHGIRLRESSKIYYEIMSREIPLEICVTSNIHTKAAPSFEEHPIRQYFDDGIIVTANTDDATVSDTNMTKELTILSQRYGFSNDEIKTVVLNGAKNAFLDREGKMKLIKDIQKEFNKLA